MAVFRKWRPALSCRPPLPLVLPCVPLNVFGKVCWRCLANRVGCRSFPHNIASSLSDYNLLARIYITGKHTKMMPLRPILSKHVLMPGRSSSVSPQLLQFLNCKATKRKWGCQ